MSNFLHETMQKIESVGKNYEGAIKFIGAENGEFGCTWDEFTMLADFRYDDGYGGAEIPGDLVVVFDDGSWLERGEYDGSEWWEYKKAPVVPEMYSPITNLKRRNYEDSVAAYQQDEEDL